jgi:hypothetical protein
MKKASSPFDGTTEMKDRAPTKAELLRRIDLATTKLANIVSEKLIYGPS